MSHKIKVRIPKGTVITGSFPGPAKVAGRTYVVEIQPHHLYAGYLPNDDWDRRHGLGVAASVSWTGAGGYWHEADWEDVEVIEGADLVEFKFPPVSRETLAAALEPEAH